MISAIFLKIVRSSWHIVFIFAQTSICLFFCEHEHRYRPERIVIMTQHISLCNDGSLWCLFCEHVQWLLVIVIVIDCRTSMSSKWAGSRIFSDPACQRKVSQNHQEISMLKLLFWFKYDLGQKYYAPQVRPDLGLNSCHWDACHDLEVMSSSPNWAELGVHGTSVLSRTWTKQSFYPYALKYWNAFPPSITT